MNQALEIIRLLGLPKAVRVKRRFDEALPHVRGYAVCSCLWALLETGALDTILAEGAVPISRLCEMGTAPLLSNRKGTVPFSQKQEKGTVPLDRHVLESILSYLDGLSLVRLEGGRVSVLPALARLMDEPRGFFELTYAYESIFANLPGMLAGQVRYPADVQRRGKYVGRGSGQLCRTLPYPVLADMLRRHGAHVVLDLGCGDLAFLFFACEARADLRAVGIDIDEPTVAYARQVLATSPHAGRVEVRRADMFDLEALSRERPDIDAVTAVDTYHEYLAGGQEKVVGLLKDLRARFPQALLYVGEFCKQPHEKLRRRPTAFLEHHLYHDLTNQTIVEADRWRAIFAAAKLRIVEEKVFDMVGHGYFVLQ